MLPCLGGPLQNTDRPPLAGVAPARPAGSACTFQSRLPVAPASSLELPEPSLPELATPKAVPTMVAMTRSGQMAALVSPVPAVAAVERSAPHASPWVLVWAAVAPARLLLDAAP